MAQVTFTNLTPKQAITLAEWFDGQGEQDCDIWFEENEVPCPSTEKIIRTDKNNIIVECKTIESE